MNLLLQTCFLCALALTGLLCGASLDQSFKQLPARRHIGLSAYSAYAKAADLKNGVWWYAITGVGSALSTLLCAALAWKEDMPAGFSTPLYAAAVFAIGHSACTSIAAPTYFKQKNTEDEKELAALFRKFVIVQSIRSVFVVLNFLVLLWVVWSLLNTW